MKSILFILVCLFCFAGCVESKTIDGTNYSTYGLLSENNKDPNVVYQPCISNVVWGIIFVETIFAPVWLFGYELYEPVAKKPTTK
jgi:hypothetical protein